jgi:hypothetical protein
MMGDRTFFDMVNEIKSHIQHTSADAEAQAATAARQVSHGHG